MTNHFHKFWWIVDFRRVNLHMKEKHTQEPRKCISGNRRKADDSQGPPNRRKLHTSSQINNGISNGRPQEAQRPKMGPKGHKSGPADPGDRPIPGGARSARSSSRRFLVGSLCRLCPRTDVWTDLRPLYKRGYPPPGIHSVNCTEIILFYSISFN